MAEVDTSELDVASIDFYPAFFWAFKTWDRIHGREPWEPDRNAYSHERISIQLATAGWLGHILPWKELAIFTFLISLFGFIHERIWHDTNYGIMPNHTVQYRRPLVKTGTYLFLSAFILFPMIRIAGLVPWWHPFCLALLTQCILYIVLETVWAKSVWGVIFTHKDDHEDHR
jgi:hypothetical protein